MAGLKNLEYLYHFYPRPPRGGRPSFCSGSTISSRFLSTPSARRATSLEELQAAYDEFLSTPSARRATLLLFLNFGQLSLFLSTPSARRATSDGCSFSSSMPISIHALREEGDGQQLDGRSSL